MKNNSFKVVRKDGSPPLLLGNLRVQPYPKTDSKHTVCIETNPDVVIKTPDMTQRLCPNFHPFCNKGMTSEETPASASTSSTVERLISRIL